MKDTTTTTKAIAAAIEARFSVWQTDDVITHDDGSSEIDIRCDHFFTCNPYEEDDDHASFTGRKEVEAICAEFATEFSVEDSEKFWFTIRVNN